MVEDGLDWDGQFEYDVVADAQSMLAQLEAEADKNPRRRKKEKGSPKSHGSGFLDLWKRYGIRNPGVRQCLSFGTADFWSSLAYESAE